MVTLVDREYAWSYLHSRFSQGGLFIVGTFLVHFVFYWVYGGILLWIQVFRPHWVSKYKVSERSCVVDRNG